MNIQKWSAGFLSGLLAVSMTAGGALAAAVGTTTAYQTNIVRNNAGTIGVGADIFLGDRLKSNSTGLGMIVFDDESSAKIGPNSNLTIDEFVYNPGSRSGKIGRDFSLWPNSRRVLADIFHSNTMTAAGSNPDTLVKWGMAGRIQARPEAGHSLAATGLRCAAEHYLRRSGRARRSH